MVEDLTLLMIVKAAERPVAHHVVVLLPKVELRRDPEQSKKDEGQSVTHNHGSGLLIDQPARSL